MKEKYSIPILFFYSYFKLIDEPVIFIGCSWTIAEQVYIYMDV